jgi:hypothetical protein
LRDSSQLRAATRLRFDLMNRVRIFRLNANV